MVQRFLKESGQPMPRSACFAVAGPVTGEEGQQRARLTNLPWQLDSGNMAATLGISDVALLNDFQAIGYSLDSLTDDELSPLHSVLARPRGPRLALGAGTGLGACLVMPDGDAVTSYASEAGHIAFAPRDEEQQALLEFMQAGLERVSYERLVSGSGLVSIYRFLLHRRGQESDALLAADDPAAAIGERAVAGDHPLAAEAVTLFSHLYGAIAGDLALACLPTGGVYIAGGIAPKLLPCLQQGAFMEAFFDKGRMTELMHRFPVHVITNTQCGLLGAANYAARKQAWRTG
jgi:glucokinase